MTKSDKSNFYTPEECRLHGGGSTYDLHLDNSIIQPLFTFEKLSNREFKTEIEKLRCDSWIGLTKYFKHIKRLIEGRILRKEEHGIGNKVDYSLTEYARKQVRLNLLGISIEDIILFRKIYQTILFNNMSERLPIRSESEEQFNRMILTELRVNSNDLHWARTVTGANEDSVDIIYQTPTMKDRRTFINKYWAERKGQSNVLEEVVFVCFPLASRGIYDVILKRIEYWQINKYSENIKLHQEYLCELPVFSFEEILARERFKDEDVNFAFNALLELEVIKPAIEFQGETRFIISDKKLRELLVGMWSIYEAEISYLTKKWKYYDAPTPEEKNRIASLRGEQEATRFFRQFDRERSQHNLELIKVRTAEEYTEYVKKGCSDYSDVLATDADLYDYKEKIRGKKKLVTDKERKYDLLKFVDFRKKRLYNDLKYLPADYKYEGIEELKREYKDTLEKYAFFQPVLKEICPKAFE